MTITRWLGAKFWSDEEGSSTIEGVLWTPIFVMFLAFTIDISMLYNQQSAMIRIVQDANRAYSLGMLETSAAAEAYIANAISDYSQSAVVATSMTDGVIETRVEIPAIDLMPLGNFIAFQDKTVVISAQQLSEI